MPKLNCSFGEDLQQPRATGCGAWLPNAHASPLTQSRVELQRDRAEGVGRRRGHEWYG